MSSTTATTPFPLGVYTGNPNGSDASAEATYEATSGSFSALMGATPQFADYYVDYTQTIPNWVSNAGWQAWSAQQSPVASGMIPVIGLALASTGDTSISQDQYYKNFASGEYDSTIQGVVQQWASHGFTTQYWRPGWEFNLTSSPSYAGDDAQTQADWVAAFQHVSTVLHQAGQADGVNVQVVWNPSTTNYSNAEATTNLYPGNAYVDVIGADVYADMYPYSLYDWGQNAGNTDSSLAQWMSDPANRAHYWTYPAATQWMQDGSGGHSLSLQNLLDFAKAQGKPFAIPETGAGNSSGGHDVADDSNFPQWLAQTLTASGDNINFVNLWDSNGGGNYEFSQASDDKPAEAAAWAQYFGAQTTASAPAQPVASAPTPATVTLGSGSDSIALNVSEDAWQGDAQFTVSVDGTQVGGTQTATASHAAGEDQTFAVDGDFGPGSHTVTVDFLNDAYGGTPSTDRNLYVDSATYDGSSVQGASLALYSAGPQSFQVSAPSTAAATPATSPASVIVGLAEDAYQGDAIASIAIDGSTIDTPTVKMLQSSGDYQAYSYQPQLAAGDHTLSVTFTNDAYGGTAQTDRNLYVDHVDINGVSYPSGLPAELASTGDTLTVPFQTT